MSNTKRLQYLNLHSLKGRRIRGDLIETYNIFNGLDINWDSIFTIEAGIHKTIYNSNYSIYIALIL